jgi:hypothetical protein
VEERIDRTDWRDRLGMDWMAGLEGQRLFASVPIFTTQYNNNNNNRYISVPVNERYRE